MNGKLSDRDMEIIIGKLEWERLKKKADEMDTDVATIIEWLVEEHLDEL